MADIPLNIFLKLIDQAGPEFKKFNKEAIDEVKKLSGEQKDERKDVEKQDNESSKKEEKNAKKKQNELEKISAAYRKIRLQMVIFTAGLGFVTLALNTFASTSKQTRDALDEIVLAGKNAISGIGELITKFSPLFQIAKASSKALNENFGNEQLNNITRAANAIRDFGQKQKENNELFIAGKITASEYFQTLISNQNEAIFKNQQFAQSFAALSQAIALAQDTQLAKIRNTATEVTNLLNTITSYQHTLAETVFKTINEGLNVFTTGLGNAVASIATGAQTASEAFKALGKQLLSTIISIFVTYAAQALIARTLGKKLVAESLAQATALAGAWGAAAVAKTIVVGTSNVAKSVGAVVGGTLLGAGIIAGVSAGFGTGAAAGGNKFHDGGFIRAHKGLAVDEVPIIAQTGEGILSRKGMRALGGEDQLNRLNKGQSSGNTLTVNINGPVIRDSLDIRKLADMLGTEIERGLRYART